VRNLRGSTAGCVVEDGLTLDINSLLQKFDLLPGNYVSGTLRWGTEAGGASASYEASLVNPKRAWLRLSYTIAYVRDGKIAHQDYRIRLATTRTHLGGVRWWFRCPVTRLRTAKLYLPSTGLLFLSRRAYAPSPSLRWRLLAHLRGQFARSLESGLVPADAETPAPPVSRPAAIWPPPVQAGVTPTPASLRRIYAERLGLPVTRSRALLVHDEC